jgi:hypothetical protein
VAIGFALSVLASCGGAVMVFGLNRIDLADLQAGGPAWTPPAIVMSAPPAAADVQAQATAGRFQPGQVTRNATASQVNVRALPGYLGKPETDVVTQIASGETVTILDGPQPADNLTWWYIRVDATGIEGWVAEATASDVQILASAE